MKKIVLGLLSAALFIGMTNEAVAQKKYKEGKITYALSFPELPEEAQAMAGMLPNKLENSFNKEASRTVLSGGMAPNTVTITRPKDQESISYANQMGNKIAMVNPYKTEETEKLEITYAEDTKEILGYTCKHAIIKTEQAEVDVYYTEELKIKDHNPQTIFMQQIEGFALEYTLSMQGLKMVNTVTNISDEKPDASLFEPLEGYKKMTREEVMQNMGGGF